MLTEDEIKERIESSNWREESFRGFLRRLLECNQLRFSKELHDSRFGYTIASRIRESLDSGGPAIVFQTGKGLVVGGVYGTLDRVRKIFKGGENLTNFEAVKKFVDCSDIRESTKDKLEQYSVFDSEPQCQEIVIAGNDVNLFDLPICRHNKLDSGNFITAGVNVVKWLDNLTHGLGIHRMKVLDSRRISVLAPPNRRIGLPVYKSSDPVEMAVVIGAPPSVVLASQSKVNHRTEKYVVAANIQESPLHLTKCKTLDLYVPSDAEIVLECESIPYTYVDDTPFGEYPGTYSMRGRAWVAKVKCITMSRDWIYQTILTGMPPQEDSNLCSIPYAAELYRVASSVVEEVTDISVGLGNGVFDTIVCVRKNTNAEIRNLILQLLGNRYVKSVTVMDSDLKANERDWRFAFNTRYQPNKDTIITDLALGASLDPSSPEFQSTSKIGFDFTVEVGKTERETKEIWKKHIPVCAK